VIVDAIVDVVVSVDSDGDVNVAVGDSLDSAPIDHGQVAVAVKLNDNDPVHVPVHVNAK
jgi:hypothetical protein